MACCVALAIVLACIRTAKARVLGREPVEDLFPPAAAWSSERDALRPQREVRPAAVGAAIGRHLAATVLAYALLIHLLAATHLAHVASDGFGGWVVRDAVFVAVAFALLILGRRRTATGSALAGAGVLWFALGVIDMHVFAEFKFSSVPLVLDAAFHLSGWWLAVVAAGVTVVQRRQDPILIGAVA